MLKQNSVEKVKFKNATDFGNNPYLYIMLGPECNMFCRHCSQIPYKTYHQCTDVMSSDVRELIGSYIRYYQGKRKELTKASMVTFWGGEALLHWNIMKSIIIEFTEKYNMLRDPSVAFCIASNGLGLTDEMVDFINQYHVQFNFSFDAPYPYAVRGYVPEETIDKILKIERVCVLGSLNALNCDLYAALSCMRAKFEGKVARFFLNFQLLYTSELPDDILAFDFEKTKKGVKMCRIAVQLGDKYFGEALYPLVKGMRSPETKRFTLETGMRYCVPGRKYLTVNLNGDVVRCHNDGRMKIGTVNDSIEDIFQRGFEVCQKIQGKKQIEKCLSCEHRDMCPGGCFMGMKTEDGYFKACDLYVKPIYSIVKEELLKLTAPVTEEDKKWFYENKPAYDKLASEYADGKYYYNVNPSAKKHFSED